MRNVILTLGVVLAGWCAAANAQVAVRGEVVYTMDGSTRERLEKGVVVITGGRIVAVGTQGEVEIPAGHRVIDAKVVTPGLIDARCTVGVSGMLNQPEQDQDQLERSSAAQPELRAIDAYNPLDPLVAWMRSLGITTIHTGHAPGELLSGQTAVFKTFGRTAGEALVVETASVSCTLGPWGQRDQGPPGTRAKSVAMLREELIRAREYAQKQKRPSPATGEEGKDADRGRDLRREVMAKVLAREVPLLVTCNRAQDISVALSVAKEFDIRIILDSASEAYLLTDEIKAAGVEVIVHPTMARMFGEMSNMSMETAATLSKAGIPVAIQGGYESYVPKSRVVLFEAAAAAANGLTMEQALATVTRDAAKILRIDGRVGSIRAGLDGDLALYDGDPFEYTTHCTGTIINGVVVNEGRK